MSRNPLWGFFVVSVSIIITNLIWLVALGGVVERLFDLRNLSGFLEVALYTIFSAFLFILVFLASCEFVVRTVYFVGYKMANAGNRKIATLLFGVEDPSLEDYRKSVSSDSFMPLLRYLITSLKR